MEGQANVINARQPDEFLGVVLKAQLSITTMEDERQVLLYTQDRSFEHQGPVSNFNGLLAAFGSKPKIFIEADIIEVDHPHREGKKAIEIMFGKVLPDQGW
jgi:hypothetical protein